MLFIPTDEKNCFRCLHVGASHDGYICTLGFGKAQLIWTGNLALICPLFEERPEPVLEEDKQEVSLA